MQAEMLRQRVEMVSSASQQQKLRGASSINSVMSRWARRRMGMAWTKWRVNEGCDVMRADMTAAHEEEMNDAMDDANETKARELAQAEAHRLNDLASSEAEKKKSLRETEGMCNADSESALYRAHSAAATAARIAAAELSFTQTEWRKEVEQVTRSAEKVVSQLYVAAAAAPFLFSSLCVHHTLAAHALSCLSLFLPYSPASTPLQDAREAPRASGCREREEAHGRPGGERRGDPRRVACLDRCDPSGLAIAP
jgi:hypothetical protein